MSKPGPVQQFIPSRQIGIRIDEKQNAWLDEEIARRQVSNPAARISKSEILREALYEKMARES